MAYDSGVTGRYYLPRMPQPFTVSGFVNRPLMVEEGLKFGSLRDLFLLSLTPKFSLPISGSNTCDGLL